MTPATLSESSLEENARSAIHRLQSSLAEAMDQVRSEWNPSTGRFSDLGTRLGIDKKLAWKIGRVMRTSDPFDAATNLPGSAGFEKFLVAAQKSGVSATSIARLRSNYTDYLALIRTHAPDKSAFETMISRYSRGGPTRTDLDQRKAAFRANAYLFGVRAKLQIRADFLHPAVSGRPEMMDVASVRGFVDLVRTRPEVAWPISRVAYRDDHQHIATSLQHLESIDPPERFSSASEFVDIPLLGEFCSRPLARIYGIASPDGLPEAMIAGGAVGQTGACTCITGEVSRDHAPTRRDANNHFTGAAVRCFTPAELFVCDQYVHRDLFGKMEYEVLQVSELNKRATGDRQLDVMRLPIRERVAYLGTGTDVSGLEAFPRFREMISHVFSRLGWKADDFFVYRLTLQYPTVPACVLIEHPLPPRAT
ncbi:MAG: hypothetical protein KF745_14900 [Phycisphaeraceae bacterium]|nr:hypothetical protein [Phycisphaeraceae bacterium]